MTNSGPPNRPKRFRGQFRTDLSARSAYSEGAGPLRIVPAAVAIPVDAEDLIVLVHAARDSGYSLVPRGAGSAMPGSNIGPGVIVDLQRFNRPVFVSANRVANIGSAITWGELDRAAAHFQLRLPPDPSSSDFCSLGGMIATNAAGARTLRYGSIRRWVRGVELVTADGELGWLGRKSARRSSRRPRPAQPTTLATQLRAVSRFESETQSALDRNASSIQARFPTASKNSGGYALDEYLRSNELVDLVIGSEGTLGIVTRLELDLAQVPPVVNTVLLALNDTDSLGDVVDRLADTEPVACEFMDRSLLEIARLPNLPSDGVAGVLLVDYEGRVPETVRGTIGDAVRITRDWCRHTRVALTADERTSMWSLRHAASAALASVPPPRRSLQVIEDGCVPVDRLGEYLRRVHEAAREHEIDIVAFGHAGNGHLHVNALADCTRPDIADRLTALLYTVTDLVIELGGTPSGEHGDGRLRGPLLERLYGAEVTSLFAAVKRSFDPDGLLNPGVIIPKPGTTPLERLKVGPNAEPIPERIAARLQDVEQRREWALSKLRLADNETNGVP